MATPQPPPPRPPFDRIRYHAGLILAAAARLVAAHGLAPSCDQRGCPLADAAACTVCTLSRAHRDVLAAHRTPDSLTLRRTLHAALRTATAVATTAGLDAITAGPREAVCELLTLSHEALVRALPDNVIVLPPPAILADPPALATKVLRPC